MNRTVFALCRFSSSLIFAWRSGQSAADAHPSSITMNSGPDPRRFSPGFRTGWRVPRRPAPPATCAAGSATRAFWTGFLRLGVAPLAAGPGEADQTRRRRGHTPSHQSAGSAVRASKSQGDAKSRPPSSSIHPDRFRHQQCRVKRVGSAGRSVRLTVSVHPAELHRSPSVSRWALLKALQSSRMASARPIRALPSPPALQTEPCR